MTNLFLLINGYSYLSTIEAYLTSQSDKLCVGDCLDHNGQMTCIYDWGGDEAKCKATKNDTKRYHTINNKICYSNCGNFDSNYSWCVIQTKSGGVNWDYCTRHIARKAKWTYATNNKYVTCDNVCAKHDGTSYFWCKTITKWEECDPDNVVLLIDYKTEDGTECATPCALYKGSPCCYDHSKSWKKCYLNPDPSSEISKISHNLKNALQTGEYKQNGYKVCKLRYKRYLTFTSPVDVEAVARYYEDNFPTVPVRHLGPQIITNDQNPVLSFTVLPVINSFGSNQINLPLSIRAVITNHTIRPPGTRERFTAEINEHFQNMNPVANDERGHIIASRLGGPTEAYNIFPQSSTHNHGRLSRWWYMEADLANFIRRNPTGYIEYTAILSYDLNNAAQGYRPTAIAIRVRFYNANGQLCDVNGNPISYLNNVLENMYFTNDPNHSCIIEGDEVEDNFNK